MSIQPVGASTAQYVPPVQTSAGGARPVEASPDTSKIQSLRDTAGVKAAETSAVPSSEQLTQAVNQIQDVIKQTANSLQFSIDKDSGTTIVKVVDTESKKVIRQIPSEEVLAIAKALDKLQGLLVKQQA